MEDGWGRLTLTHLSCEHVLSDFLLACSPSSCTHTPLPQNHQAPGLLLPSLWLQLREQLQGCGSAGSFCAWAGNYCASPVSPAMRQLVWTPVGLQAALGHHRAGTPLTSWCETHSLLSHLAGLSGNSPLPGWVVGDSC